MNINNHTCGNRALQAGCIACLRKTLTGAGSIIAALENRALVGIDEGSLRLVAEAALMLLRRVGGDVDGPMAGDLALYIARANGVELGELDYTNDIDDVVDIIEGAG